MKRKREHVHRPRWWDGFYERCRCGVSSGDRKDPETGLRYVFFRQWGETS